MTKAATGFWRRIADFFVRLFRWLGFGKPVVPEKNGDPVAEPPATGQPPNEMPEPEPAMPELPGTEPPVIEEPPTIEEPPPTEAPEKPPLEETEVEPPTAIPEPEPVVIPGLSDVTKSGPDVVTGLGVWIWVLKQSEYGSITRIIERAKRAGLSWVTIKGGDGVNRWGQFTPEVVGRLQEAGLKVLGWVYAYGRDSLGEAEVAKSVLETGCDGLIIDAEAEYECNASAAEAYMRAIRAAYPNAFVAYSSFPLISKHRYFPYVEFGRYCDAAMPQCYWHLIGISPEEMMRKTEEEWDTWAEAMEAAGLGASVVPLIPVGQGFNVTPDAVVRFLELSSKYAGASLWSWTHMTGDLWETLAGLPEGPRRDPEPKGE